MSLSSAVGNSTIACFASLCCFVLQPPADSTGWGKSSGFKINGCERNADGPSVLRLIKDHPKKHFSDPWGDVRFQVQYVGNTVLRVKIYDAANVRHEVPVPLNLPTAVSDPAYDFVLSDEPFFHFKVIRRSNNSTLFDTSLKDLILEDQYMSITTKVPNDKIYGLGKSRDRMFRHDLETKEIVPMWAKNSVLAYESGTQYGFHPFYMVIEKDGKAHGCLIRISNGIKVEFQESPTIQLDMIGGIMDLYFILGDSPEHVVQQYTGMIGRPAIPPYWALGFQLARWGYNSTEKVRETVKAMKEAGIPQDVQTFDIDYMRFRQDFTVDWENFTGMENFVKELKSDGIHTIIILVKCLIEPARVTAFGMDCTGNTCATHGPCGTSLRDVQLGWTQAALIFKDPAIHADAATKHPNDPPYMPYVRGVEQDVFLKWPENVTDIDDVNIGPNRAMLGKIWPDGRVAYPDFFTDKAQKWWKEEIRLQHKTLKFDGLWIDMNEPTNFGTNTNGKIADKWYCTGEVPGNHDCIGLRCPDNKWEKPALLESIGKSLTEETICMTVEHECVDGKRCKHYDVHNMYGWSVTEPTLRGVQEATGKRSVVVVRSTYPGSGQWTGHWLGDNVATWNDLQHSTVGLFYFNMMGIPYVGADICGFLGQTNEELCTRWHQIGAFYPYSRNHNEIKNEPQEPYRWPKVAHAARKALGIRYRLLPFLYTLFYHAHVDGNTVIRPLHHEFPADKHALEIETQFFWGKSLMIVPVVKKNRTEVEAYFPDAIWYDYEGRREDTRGAFRNISMPLNRIGVYFRGGYVLPAQVPAQNTMQSRKNLFQYIIVLDENSHATGDLFWDDGDSIDPVKNGNYLRSYLSFHMESPTSGMFHCHVDVHGNAKNEEIVVGELHFIGLPYEPESANITHGSAEVQNLGHVSVIKIRVPLKTSFTLHLYG